MPARGSVMPKKRITSASAIQSAQKTSWRVFKSIVFIKIPPKKGSHFAATFFREDTVSAGCETYTASKNAFRSAATPRPTDT